MQHFSPSRTLTIGVLLVSDRSIFLPFVQIEIDDEGKMVVEVNIAVDHLPHFSDA